MSKPGMGKRAAIFDLDGTLADSAPDIAGALNRALRHSGLPQLPTPDVIAMVGHGALSLCERALKALDQSTGRAALEALHAGFLAEYDKVPCGETRLYPGALACLDRLGDDGWHLAICTNKPQMLAEQVLDALAIRHRFGVVIGGRDGIPLKPSAAMVELALDGIGMAGSALQQGRSGCGAVFIGDSKADLGAARATGLPVVLLTHGYSSLPVSTLGADAVLDGFDGLAATLAELVAERPTAVSDQAIA